MGFPVLLPEQEQGAPLRFDSRSIVDHSGRLRAGAGSVGAAENSRRSSVPSSRTAGSGQDRPALSARRRYSSTAGREIPQLLGSCVCSRYDSSTRVNPLLSNVWTTSVRASAAPLINRKAGYRGSSTPFSLASGYKYA
jgi:hypothetical protein